MTSFKQLRLLKPHSKSYGGTLLKTRKGRSHGRPLDTKNSMHMVLRSSRATGSWSFRRHGNPQKIAAIVQRFSRKYGVKIISLANVGNHLHFHIQLTNRHAYKPFIRAVTSAIAMAVTGVNRWTKQSDKGLRFWDYRPFTRVILGWKAILSLRDYIEINQLEGQGYARPQARFVFDLRRDGLANQFDYRYRHSHCN